MKTTEQIAADWVALARIDSATAPADVFVRGWAIYEMAEHEPVVAWNAIRAVVERYDLSDLISDPANEAKTVIANTAAGPLEDLLARHGASFIDKIEIAARQDPRMKWALRGVWQNSMPNDIWDRVQQAGL